MSSDESYMYRDQVRELQNINDFVRKNTLLQVKSRLEYLLNEREKAALPINGLRQAIEIVKAMIDG
jgi:hypothetical protein